MTTTNWAGWLQIGLYLAVLLVLAKPLGLFMARVFEGRRTLLSPVLGPVERATYRLAGVQSGEGGEQDWKTYAVAMLLFNVLGIVVVYALQRAQGMLPLNPQGFGAVSPDSSFNTAVSFATNTNWQGYGGETTMSYLTQMTGLAVQNFVSAASGIAVLIALIRGMARRSARTIGNFWVDLTRSTLYVLLPLSLVWAVILCSQGVIQTFSPSRSVTLVQPTGYDAPRLDAAGHPIVDAAGRPATERVVIAHQTLPMGPVASQVAIKHLGTNGGGFFNANAAHPYENPTPFSDLVLVLGQTLIAAALCHTFGVMVGDRRQGWAILAAMLIMFVALVAMCWGAEAAGNPAFTAAGADQVATSVNPGGNMEGKEVRFGIARSALFAVSTTATSCGAVNSMHDSFTPLGGLIPMWLIQLGEVVLGGVGSGLCGMLMFVIVAVFVAGLMVGRTPEYLAKKIGPFEMKMASLAILVAPLLVLVGAAVAVSDPAGRVGVANPGAHGFSEILYATSSASNNNGSAFAGISANTPFYNTLLAVCMFFGRFFVMVPVLAIAGSLAAKHKVAVTEGTLPTHTPLFVALLVSTIVIVGALTFVPALALGPIVEQLQMLRQ